MQYNDVYLINVFQRRQIGMTLPDCGRLISLAPNVKVPPATARGPSARTRRLLTGQRCGCLCVSAANGPSDLRAVIGHDWWSIHAFGFGGRGWLAQAHEGICVMNGGETGEDKGHRQPSGIKRLSPYSTEWGGHCERWISATRHWRSMIAPIRKETYGVCPPTSPHRPRARRSGWHSTCPRFSSAPPDDEAGGSCIHTKTSTPTAQVRERTVQYST